MSCPDVNALIQANYDVSAFCFISKVFMVMSIFLYFKNRINSSGATFNVCAFVVKCISITRGRFTN